MNYIGMKVSHKLFGEGEIYFQEQSASTIVYVKFTKTGEKKSFAAPQCFEKFLTMVNKEDSSIIKEALEQAEKEKDEEKAAERREQKERQEKLKAQRMRQERPTNYMTVPTYSTVESFCDDQEILLREEIEALRKNGGKRHKLYDGRLLERRGSRSVYSFETDTELDLPGDTEISLWIRDEPISGSVIACEEFTILIASAEDLGKQVSELEFSAEPWRLTEYLIERLEEIKEHASPIVRSLLFDGRKKAIIWKAVYRGQDKALQMSHSQPITMIWGPPGTGKTETLARIAIDHIHQGKRVLMLSYSNVSVDGAVWRTFGKATDSKPGTILRYGYAKDKTLLEHEYLTAYNYVLRNHPELERERNRLSEERKRYGMGSAEKTRISKRLQEIHDTVKNEEKNAVLKASFIATTVSKATADSTLYENRFDTVIFDEASMAYVPQIVFSASLAKSHFICLGDFSQLPPIVQSSNTSRLNMDIFRYCGIVDAVAKGIGHEWLCMLDIQHRMHPQIADFAGNAMYQGLLKSAPDMEKKTKGIVLSAPMAPIPMQLLDLSGMLSVCKNTPDRSHVNVLSALFSMALAIEAAGKYEVGIITPYSAQSRLLHAMARDVAENHPDLNKIACATVHQFQGSEKDMIIFDAVDCYRSPYPGRMLTLQVNDYANRLFNVALTRAKGKMIAVANRDYMKSKGIANGLMFARFLDTCARQKMTGNTLYRDFNQSVIQMTADGRLDSQFEKDLRNAEKEILIDIPGQMENTNGYAADLTLLLNNAKKRKIRVIVRAENKPALPEYLRNMAVGNEYVYNPVTMIDRKIIWFGQPHSLAAFQAEGKTLETICRPVIRFEGKYTGRVLYGFLEMNQTIERTVNTDGAASGFPGFAQKNIRCSQCGASMQVKISKRGTFYMSCSAYPKCRNMEYVQVETVQEYLNSNGGKRCPVDHTLLKVKAGNRGVRIYCSNNEERHFFKLDEI